MLSRSLGAFQTSSRQVRWMMAARLTATAACHRTASTSSPAPRMPQVGVAVVILRARDPSPELRAAAGDDAALAAYPVVRPAPVDATEVLLVQRAKAPMRGWWGLPGGKLEIGETMQAAAEREVLEECGLHVVADPTVITVTEFISPSLAASTVDAPAGSRGHHILMFLRAQTCSLPTATTGDRRSHLQVARAGDDAAAVRWFAVSDLERHIASQSDRQPTHDGEATLADPASESPLIIPAVLTVLAREREQARE